MEMVSPHNEESAVRASLKPQWPIGVPLSQGVEEAFYYSDRVLTFSVHKFCPGFFPGQGVKLPCSMYGIQLGSPVTF